MRCTIPDPLGCACSCCGDELDEDEPAIRVRPVKGPAQVFCWNCCTPALDLTETECDGCARPLTLGPSLLPYCSRRCRKWAKDDRALARRHAVKARRRCAACEQSLGAARTDAIYCSAACRGFMHRLNRLAS